MRLNVNIPTLKEKHLSLDKHEFEEWSKNRDRDPETLDEVIECLAENFSMKTQGVCDFILEQLKQQVGLNAHSQISVNVLWIGVALVADTYSALEAWVRHLACIL
ncbi:MAG: hypothetical protein HC836_28230 [Richelia sp. RM2_1_2]|nr:hypothetical protein [Richelia sp. SM2_1_7]NJM20320.1 hypothetical protein [Richelia sp. SM1_7_0]NJN11104.1 hypothetical protein [Richelia sp. RM1_1_1]NJO29903.1 hypothetical protein [Richelia sp. SL_2_1]NJO61987.1 hypothetical protein [Richelia sp. RM2_1_2]